MEEDRTMEEGMIVRVRMPRSLPEEDRLGLMSALSAGADVHEEEARGFGPEIDWVTMIAVVKDVGTLAGAGTAVLGLVNELLAWRKRAREKGTQADAVIEAPGRTKLELTSASDAEVRAWFEARA
jgi:hypothetical protein